MNYFSHDSNARSDPKIAALINDFGYEGYGIWWAIVEIIHEQGGKLEKFPKLFEGLEAHLSGASSKTKQNISASSKVKQVVSASINEYSLLKEDEKYIWSERVLRNIKTKEQKTAQRVEAGRLGGIKSGQNRRKLKQNEAPLEANEANEANKTKLNKIKLNNKYSPNSVEFKLANLLLDLILIRNPTYKKPDVLQWTTHIDKMMRLDKREAGDIEQVIRWCQSSVSKESRFWNNNILSTEKLRSQFDQLKMKMTEDVNGNKHARRSKSEITGKKEAPYGKYGEPDQILVV